MQIDPRQDQAFEILNPADLDNEIKAQAWDHFHHSKTAEELQQRLSQVDLPVHVEQQLINAKQSSEVVAAKPMPTSVDRTMKALTRLTAIPKNVLDLAEKHPHVAAHLVNAARDEE